MSNTRALTISGGGLHGAFAVGVVLGLAEHGVRDYGIISGTSTGSLIAPLTLLGDFDRIEESYGSADTAKVYEKFSGLKLGFEAIKELLHGEIPLPPALGTLDPLRERLHSTLKPDDWDRLTAAGRSGKKLLLATVDLITGETVYWGLAGPSYKRPVRIIADLDMLVDAMVASSTIPFASAPTMLPDHGSPHPHVDGGVRAELPAWRCVEEGATEFYVVVIQPPGLDPKPGAYDSGADIVERVTSLMSFQDRTDAIRALRGAAEFAAFQRAIDDALDGVAGGRAAIQSIQAPDVYRDSDLDQLVLIRPAAPLPGGTLSATEQQMQEMIEIGKRQAAKALSGGGGPFVAAA